MARPPIHTDNTWLSRIAGYLDSIDGSKSGSQNNNANVINTGGIYRSVTESFVDSASVVNHYDIAGNQLMSLGTTIAGEDITNNVIKVEERFSYTNITTNATTTVKSGAGFIHGFLINNNGFTTAGTITVYDNTAASGTKIGTWTIPLQPPGSVLLSTPWFPPQLLDVTFSTGLTFVTATTAPACDITVMWR